MTEASIAASADIAAVRQANDRWYAALNAMIAGDPEPLKDVYSHGDDVTYMPAEGAFWSVGMRSMGTGLGRQKKAWAAGLKRPMCR